MTSSKETEEQDVKKIDNNGNNCISKGMMTSNEETKEQDVKKLDDKISRKLSTSSEEFEEHDVKKLEINNNKNNNKINNNMYIYNNQKIKIKDKVYLTKKQYSDLVQKYGKEKTDNIITRLDLYKKSTGKVYKDDYATILLWINSNMKKSNVDFTEDSEWMKNAKENFGNNLEGLYANYNNFNN